MKDPTHDIYQDGDGGKSIHSSFNINEPMPWVVLVGLIAALALAYALGAQSRFADIIAMQQLSAKQAHDLAWNAQTECMLVKEHVDTLEHTMAAHGILSPPLKETPRC